MDFTCPECGAVATAFATGDPQAWQVRIMMASDQQARCKGPPDPEAPGLTDGYPCPHLAEALDQALARPRG